MAKRVRGRKKREGEGEDRIDKHILDAHYATRSFSLLDGGRGKKTKRGEGKAIRFSNLSMPARLVASPLIQGGGEVTGREKREGEKRWGLYICSLLFQFGDHRGGRG